MVLKIQVKKMKFDVKPAQMANEWPLAIEKLSASFAGEGNVKAQQE